MNRATYRPTFRSISRISHGMKYSASSEEEVFDPYTLITGTPHRSATFDALAADAALNGTAVTGGSTWVTDAGWVGATGGYARSGTSGQAAKHNLAHTDCLVRMIWNPGATGNNQLSIWARDTQSTAWPRYGFLLSTYPAHTLAPPAQAVALYRNDNYVFTNVTGFVEATINRGWNVLELRCMVNTITGFLNGVSLVEIEDTTYTNARSRWGFAQTNIDNTDARVDYVDMTLI